MFIELLSLSFALTRDVVDQLQHHGGETPDEEMWPLSVFSKDVTSTLATTRKRSFNVQCSMSVVTQ